jgi:hypothetical protein
MIQMLDNLINESTGFIIKDRISPIVRECMPDVLNIISNNPFLTYEDVLDDLLRQRGIDFVYDIDISKADKSYQIIYKVAIEEGVEEKVDKYYESAKQEI